MLINTVHRYHLLSTHYLHGGAEKFIHPLSHLILSTFEVHPIIIINIVILRSLTVNKPVYLKPHVFPIYLAVGTFPMNNF